MKLGDCCLKIGSGATPRGGKEAYLEKGLYTLIRSQNIHNNLFVRAGMAFISDEQAKQLQNVDIKKDDVLLNITGDSVARVCQVPDDVLPAGVNQHVAIIRPNPKRIFHQFLHYYLVNPKMQSHMLMLASAGATRNALTKGMIEAFEVPATSLSEQKAIASVLGALDDKIENNRQINETLEEMARAIFKSWFVDFDPVHAKATGNPPAHMDADTAALFPSSFYDDGFPMGWKERPMSETVTLIGGGTPKTKEASYWGGDINWFSVVDAPSISDVWVIDTEKKITKKGLDNSSAKLLPPKSTIISARGTVGKTALTLSEISMNQSCYGIVGANGYSSFYTYFSIRKMVSELQANAHGSVFDTITKDTFSSVKVTRPPIDISSEFDKSVGNMLDTISNNLIENKTLAELRDLLLPKLMSGEIRVADAEREVEAAI